MNASEWLIKQVTEGKAWRSKIGKYVHSVGCDANASMQCLCDFPYPVPKEILDEAR